MEKSSDELTIIVSWPQVKAVVFGGDDTAAGRWVRSFKMNGRAATDPKTGALIWPEKLGDRRWHIKGFQADNRDGRSLAERIEAVPMPSPADMIRAQQQADASSKPKPQ